MRHDEDDSVRSGVATAHARLEEHGVQHEILEHVATFRAADDARAVDAAGRNVAKTIVAVDHDHYWLAVVPAARTVDLERLRHFTGASRHLRLATEDEIDGRFAEFEVGATPPLGALIGADQVIDPLVLAHDTIICSGGDHQHAISVSAEAFVEASGARVADIASHVADEHRGRFADTPYL
jgi:Ala-tRNA(Pro) deacylase